jgi:hypothetical protein
MNDIRSEMFKTALRATAQLLNEKARLLSGKEPEGLGDGDINEIGIALETLMDAHNGYIIEFDMESDSGQITWTKQEEGEAA